MDKKIKEIKEGIKIKPRDDCEGCRFPFDIQYLLSRIKELEDNIDDPEWCCEKHKAGLVARIKELEEELKCSQISDEDLQKLGVDE